MRLHDVYVPPGATREIGLERRIDLPIQFTSRVVGHIEELIPGLTRLILDDDQCESTQHGEGRRDAEPMPLEPNGLRAAWEFLEKRYAVGSGHEI
jgi:hypothetical protein